MKTPRIFFPALWIVIISLGILSSCTNQAPQQEQADVTSLHLLRPDYPVPYEAMSEEDLIAVLERIRQYLDEGTPVGLVDRNTGEAITDWSAADTSTRIAPGDFRLVSYEWGVLYAGMLLAGEFTGDPAFTEYTVERMKFLAEVIPAVQGFVEEGLIRDYSFRSIVDPRTLDDAGAMCAAMIKTVRSGAGKGLEPFIQTYMDHISNKQFRLDDGTLARPFPHPHTLWLDDLFMSVPALAQMGKWTGETKYYDDAVMQILQFSERMFVKEKGIFIHGWAEEMDPHPYFHWGRANGWAIMATVELLDVLPEDHPGRDEVLGILRAHIRGLASYQSGQGLWHQLIDRPDSYLETSSSAMFTYATAKAINRDWVDYRSYGPMVTIAWSALAKKVNETGQVEGTCVGTGMGFDPVFYYYRPVNVYAANGYGPMFLAGAEVLKMNRTWRIDDRGGALRLYTE